MFEFHRNRRSRETSGAIRLALVATLCVAAWGCGSGAESSKPDDAAGAEAERPVCAMLGRDAPDASVDELPIYASGPVATLEGRPLPASIFNHRARRLASWKRDLGELPARKRRAVGARLLRGVVTDCVVAEALARSDVEVTEEEISEEMRRFRARYGGDEEKFRGALRRVGLGPDEVRRKVVLLVGSRKLLRKNGEIAVSDEQVEAFYEANRAHFERDEEVRARHILVALPENPSDAQVAEARERAAELAARAREPNVEFTELVEANSDANRRLAGGDLGFFTRERVPDAFADVAFALEVGEVSGPVRTQFGFHVIKLVERRGARTTSLDDVREKLRGRLERQQLQQARRAWIERRMQEWKVEIRPEAVVFSDGSR